MKFTLPAAALSDAAAYAAKGISPRPPAPVLSGLLIEAQPGGLRISGFDYEKSARTQVAADVDAPGTLLVQGKMFTDIIRKLGKKTVTITADERRATITAGSAVFTMAAMPVTEFPPMPDLPTHVGTIDGAVLAAAVSQVIGAASTDDTLPILTAVQIVSQGAELTLRTTDRYRLAEVTVPWTPAGDDVSLLARGGWLADTIKTLAGDAQILADGNLIGIRSGNRATTAITIDGDYPKISALFPASFNTEVTVNRNDFADVLGRVALVAERNTPARLTTHDGELTIEAGTGGDATGRETIPCQVSHADIQVAVNPGYLAWSLAVNPTADITLGFQENLAKPVHIGGTEGLRHIIMPIRAPK